MITPENVDELAALARLKLAPEEKAGLAKDLESILGYVSELKTAKLDEVDPAVDNYLPVNVFRTDNEALPSGAETETLLSAAADRSENYLKVKKIL